MRLWLRETLNVNINEEQERCKELFMSRDLYLVTWFVKSSEKLKKRRLWG